jgi:homocysteine S-methyltransferase
MTARLPDVMVLDGGFGTELERQGCDVRGALWSAEALLRAPGMVEAVHAAYLEAGADCITTGSTRCPSKASRRPASQRPRRSAR